MYIAGPVCSVNLMPFFVVIHGGNTFKCIYDSRSLIPFTGIKIRTLCRMNLCYAVTSQDIANVDRSTYMKKKICNVKHLCEEEDMQC